MKIMDHACNLEKYLDTFSSRDIHIISAFASGTHDIIQKLLKNQNNVSILVGTINYFTKPIFLRECIATKQALSIDEKKSLNLFVDFGIQDSIHWKTYLISPDIVIVGSANFTVTGVGMKRDMCIQVTDSGLYAEYIKRFHQLTLKEHVFSSIDKKFTQKLNGYEKTHKRIQARNFGSQSYSDLAEWLHDETNETLPCFIWSDDLSHEEKTIGKKLMPKIAEKSNDTLEHYACFEDKRHYRQGDLVLCSKTNGGYLKFVKFDFIKYSKTDEQYYVYTTNTNEDESPFQLAPLKQAIKKCAPQWYEKDITELSRADLNQLLIESNKNLK